MTDGPVEAIKTVGDGFAVIVTVGAVVKILPAIASGLTIIWLILRIYESATVQRWIHGRKAKP